MLDWISETDEPEEPPIDEAAPSEVELSIPDEDEGLPDWLTSIKTGALDTEAEADSLEIDIPVESEGDDDILDDEALPSWLTEDTGEQLFSDETPAAEAEVSPDITPAEPPIPGSTRRSTGW